MEIGIPPKKKEKNIQKEKIEIRMYEQSILLRWNVKNKAAVAKKTCILGYFQKDKHKNYVFFWL